MIDMGWVILGIGLAGLMVFIYFLGKEVGDSTGRKADTLHQRDRAMAALLRIVPSEDDPRRRRPYNWEEDGL